MGNVSLVASHLPQCFFPGEDEASDPGIALESWGFFKVSDIGKLTFLFFVAGLEVLLPEEKLQLIKLNATDRQTLGCLLPSCKLT